MQAIMLVTMHVASLYYALPSIRFRIGSLKFDVAVPGGTHSANENKEDMQFIWVYGLENDPCFR